MSNIASRSVLALTSAAKEPTMTIPHVQRFSHTYFARSLGRMAALALASFLTLAGLGCAAEQGDAPASGSAALTVSMDQARALVQMSRALMGVTSALERMDAEQSLDAELVTLWHQAEDAGYQSDALTYVATDEEHARVDRAAVETLAHDVQALEPLWPVLEARGTRLDSALRDAFAAFGEANELAADLVASEDSAPGRLRGLRKEKCCLHFLDGALVACEDIKATRIGAHFRCTLPAFFDALMGSRHEVQISGGSCDEQPAC